MKKIIIMIACSLLIAGFASKSFGQHYSRDICEGDTVIYWGNVYSQSGTYQDGSQHLSLRVHQPVVTFMQYGSVCPVLDSLRGFSRTFGSATQEWFLNGTPISTNNPGSNDGFINPALGTYTLIVTSTIGCGTDTASIVVVPCGAYVDSVHRTICSGDTVLFHGQILSYTGVYTYPINTDTVETLFLTVNPTPHITLVQQGSLCQGNDTLKAFIHNSQQGNPIQIDWILNNSVVASSSPTVTNIVSAYTPTVSGTYTVIATNTAGCSDTASIIVVPCSSGSTTTQHICEGDSFLFGGQLYGSSGTYINGSDTLHLGVNPTPTLTLTPYGSVCPTLALDSLVATPPTNVPAAIKWWFNGDSIAPDYYHTYIQCCSRSIIYTPSAGIYTAVASTTSGCTDTATFTVAPCGSTTTQHICEGDSFLFGGQLYGSSGTYINGADTLILSVVLPIHDSIYATICSGTSYNFNGATLTQAGTYYDTLQTSQGCDSILTLTLTVNVCSSNGDVWPGDTDHNGVCDNYDLLPIGIAHGLGGAARTSTSIVWQGWQCPDWGLQLQSGTNAKHIDCNGDGQINVNDAQAVIQNFGLTHSKNEEERKASRDDIASLDIVFLNDTLHAGDTLVANIRLGKANMPAENVYGLAFTYNFDRSVIDTASISFTYPDSWLGNSSDRIYMVKELNDIGQIKTAITRIDHTNRSGSGEIAQFRAIITTDNINGKDLGYYTTSHFITGLKAIDKDENSVELNEGIDSAKIGYEITGIAQVKNEISWQLYPNPAQNSITIKSTENIEGLVIYNVLGAKLYVANEVRKSTEILDVSNFPNGVYIAQIETAAGIGQKRFVIAK